MPHKLRKTRKKRGSRTYGYGRVGQHRKSGSKGGKGKAGHHKHLWSYVQSHDPDYFKKESLKPSPRTAEKKIINLKQLEEIAIQLKSGKKKKVTVNLEKMGYDKLLGAGNITIPVSVKVAQWSQTAQEKIEAAGGEIMAAA
ncbi:50S ribosomal protein L15 [Candidatus Bathyarchaeota archaeon]|nr:MAG: 50S ribosomal protein L15 [Candidatus Bathyarchaeota archaeon]